jgi:hypothetical protein
VIKLDIEGAELTGATNVLRSARPLILLELAALLERAGYRLLCFDRATGLPVPVNCSRRCREDTIVCSLQRHLPPLFVPATSPQTRPRVWGLDHFKRLAEMETFPLVIISVLYGGVFLFTCCVAWRFASRTSRLAEVRSWLGRFIMNKLSRPVSAALTAETG